MNQAHHPQKSSIKSIISLCLISTVLSQALPAYAQIIPDNTLSSEASQLKQNLIINGALGDKIDGGAIRGSNLFHSFSEFNIENGQRVYFGNPTGIENILTRVTGGNASNIFGTLGVNGAANLFLINPNGILFGENARLDVQGSFVGTTANGVQFGNQGIFSATNPKAAPLLTIQPSALWFNQLNQGAGIQNNSIARAGTDPAGFNVYGLRVPDGKSLLLVGGNVNMDGGELNAYGGRVELGGLAAPGNVNLLFNGDNLSLKFPLNVTRADVSLTNEARVYVEAAGGGDIVVNARNIDILGGSLLNAGIAEGLGKPEATAGDITLNATGDIKVADSGSKIRNLVSEDSKGNGGNITIDSGSFFLSDGAQLSASTYGQGNAGNVTVGAKDAISLAGGDIFSNVGTGGVGNSGGINIRGSSLSLTDGALLSASIYGQGNAGNVIILAKDKVSFSGTNSGVLGAVDSLGIGNGANINIRARSLSLANGAQIATSTLGKGSAGNIQINADDSIFVRSGSVIQAATFGQGNAGSITIERNTVSLDGVGSNNISSGAYSAVGPFAIPSPEFREKRSGGDITITAEKVSLTNGAQLSASTYGQGNAGNVTVGAKDAISLANGKIFSNVETGGVGNSGGINIRGSSLSLTDGAQLQSGIRGADTDEVAGRGNGGSININLTGALTISGTKGELASAIFTDVETGARGNGGNIDISSGSFSLSDGARLVASTGGQGLDSPKSQAGNITLNTTGKVEVAGADSAIRTTLLTGGVGNGGNITIDSGDFSLRDGAQLNTSTYGQGNAGNVTVGAKNAISLVGGDIFSTVEAGGVGKGGNIDINAATLSLTDSAQLLTSTRGASATQPAGQGDAGNVNVLVTGAVDIAGEKNGFPSGIRSNVGTGTVGNGGNIFIDSGDFSLSDGAQLNTSTYGQGNAGNVTVGAKNAVDLAGSNSSIFSIVGAGGDGKGGNIDINVRSLSLANGAQIATSTLGKGSAGNIQINADDSVFVSNDSVIQAVTFGQGNAGSITIEAGNTIFFDGVGSNNLTGAYSVVGPLAIPSPGFTGKRSGGDITIKAQRVSLTNSAELEASTYGQGNGGNIFIDSGSFSLGDGAQLNTSTYGQGNAGNVTVIAKDAVSLVGGDIYNNVETGGVGNSGGINIRGSSLSLTDGAQLQSGIRGADTDEVAGRGNGGSININLTGALTISGTKGELASAIFTNVETGARGNGGNIDISSGSFSLSDGARLVASTGGQGLDSPKSQAGNITLNTTGKVEVAGADSAIRTTLLTGGVGNGGNITIDSGDFSLRDGAQLNTSTYGQGNAGNVTVGAKNAVDLAGNAYILSTVEAGGVGKGGNIDINATTLSLTDGAQLLTITRGASATQPAGQGNAGNVNVLVTGAVDIAGEKNGFTSGIRSNVDTGTVGNCGNIFIDSGDFSLSDGALLNASTFGLGNAGNVTVRAKDAISLAGNGSILSTVEAGGVGKGGNIDINATTLSLTDGGQLLTATLRASATQPAGQGDAGNVNVLVTDTVDIVGQKNGFPSAIFSFVDTGTVGNGGNIFIDSGDLSLSDGAQLVASTLGQGNAGNVTVRAKDAISLAGQPTAIFSTVEAGGVGKGGNIDINATTLSLTDGGQLLTATLRASATQPAGQGDAGNVNVLVTDTVDIVGQKNGFPSAIFSFVDTGTVGNGGNIFIDSGDLSLSDGAQLVASTLGQGNAGNVRIHAKDTVTVSGTNQETGLSSALFTFTDSNSQGKGGDISVNTNIFRVSDGALLDARTRNNQKGGDITVNANVFEALNGGQLTTITSSNGRAGKITVNADDKVIISDIDPSYSDRIAKFPDNVVNIGANSGLFVSSTGSGITGDIEINSPKITLDNQGKLNAESASGNGGNINVNSDFLLLRHGAQISTNAGTAEKGGDGGNININSKFIVAVPKENSDISANAFTGTGGNIQINSQGIFGIESRPKLTEKSDITASSELGVSGVTNINTPDNSSIQNSFTGLSPNVIDTNALIANSCISRGTKRQENSFTITGSGALRYTPGDVLTSAYTTGDVRSIEPTPRHWKKGDPIIEPQGLYRLPNGQLILSRSCSK
ncbi:filamentous hemagglutinin N-terminal domain-containing protein [Nostoc sp. LPT]|uniref:two-partner secretion domain-containing protein n=1 Tax=Nostoc sp. LPT TaxID=2815387 RepID=UPI0025F5C9AC|nr:filamentous hemagglutinin N-terminal domain-containing protein [Nostoc sp. LPT]